MTQTTAIPIVVAGAPLAGKTTLLETLGKLPGATFTRSVVKVPNAGSLTGWPISMIELAVTSAGTGMLFRTLPGSLPVEGLPGLLRGHEAGVFVVDGSDPRRIPMEIEHWEASRPLAPRWCVVVNRRPTSTIPAAELLEKIGIPGDVPLIESPLTADGEAERLAEFVVQHAARRD